MLRLQHLQDSIEALGDARRGGIQLLGRHVRGQYVTGQGSPVQFVQVRFELHAVSFALAGRPAEEGFSTSDSERLQNRFRKRNPIPDDPANPFADALVDH